jgi:hypothetical protein
MGNPFLFADRFSGAVVHLTTGRIERPLLQNNKKTVQTKNARDSDTGAGIS